MLKDTEAKATVKCKANNLGPDALSPCSYRLVHNEVCALIRRQKNGDKTMKFGMKTFAGLRLMLDCKDLVYINTPPDVHNAKGILWSVCGDNVYNGIHVYRRLRVLAQRARFRADPDYEHFLNLADYLLKHTRKVGTSIAMRANSIIGEALERGVSFSVEVSHAFSADLIVAMKSVSIPVRTLLGRGCLSDRYLSWAGGTSPDRPSLSFIPPHVPLIDGRGNLLTHATPRASLLSVLRWEVCKLGREFREREEQSGYDEWLALHTNNNENAPDLGPLCRYYHAPHRAKPMVIPQNPSGLDCFSSRVGSAGVALLVEGLRTPSRCVFADTLPARSPG